MLSKSENTVNKTGLFLLSEVRFRWALWGTGGDHHFRNFALRLRYNTVRYFTLQFATLPLYLTPFPLYIR